MMYASFLKAAESVLEGDETRAAASQLERAILDEHEEDDRFDDLLEALALYAPGSGSPYFEASELRRVLSRTIRDLGFDVRGDGQAGSRGV